MVGGSRRVLQLLSPLRLVAMICWYAEILLKVALNNKNQIKSKNQTSNHILLKEILSLHAPMKKYHST